MSTNDIVLCRQAIEPGLTAELAGFLPSRIGEREGLLESFEAAGIAIESVFIHRWANRDELLIYVEATDLDAVLEEWRSAEDDPARREQKAFERSLVDGNDKYLQDQADLLLHADVESGRLLR